MAGLPGRERKRLTVDPMQTWNELDTLNVRER